MGDHRDATSSPSSEVWTTETVALDASGPLVLVVSTDAEQVSWPMPEAGEIVIGRSRSSHVRIDDPSVSREHVMLSFGEAPGARAKDLGSRNGTMIRGRPLVKGEWQSLAVGEVMDVGSVMVTLRVVRSDQRPQRVWPHGYFEGRVEEECARCARSERPFSILRVRAEGRRAVVEEALRDTLRAHDVVALYAPGELEVLLTEAGRPQAEVIAARVLERLTARAVTARTAIVAYPTDGVTAESLMARLASLARGVSGHQLDLAEVPRSPAMRPIWNLIEQIAPSKVSVLLQGETGVGKEIAAEAIHRLSPRADRTFLRLHCAALPETLIESELFGHEKGAFTGAIAAKPGLIEAADQGTVFLDEIGELPPGTQVKLLRVLDAREVLRVGSLVPRKVDVRFVAATNRSLEAEVAAGRFREDLYYRLAGMTLKIPPLRERVSEIALLALRFAEVAAAEQGRPPPRITPEVMHALRAYAWPGNVRELRNVIERAVVLCGDGPILLEHLPLEKLSTTGRLESAVAGAPAHAEFEVHQVTARIERGGLRKEVEALEKERILGALEQCGGNQSKAARQLGMSRGALLARLRAWGLLRPGGKR